MNRRYRVPKPITRLSSSPALETDTDSYSNQVTRIQDRRIHREGAKRECEPAGSIGQLPKEIDLLVGNNRQNEREREVLGERSDGAVENTHSKLLRARLREGSEPI